MQVVQSALVVQASQWVIHAVAQFVAGSKKPGLHVAHVVAAEQVAQLPYGTEPTHWERIRVGASRRTAITITFILIINLKAHGLNTLFDAI